MSAIKNVLSYFSFGMTNAAIRFPITCEDIRNAQKKLLKNPEFSFYAQFEIYFPSATQRILAPKPHKAAPNSKNPYMKLYRLIQVCES